MSKSNNTARRELERICGKGCMFKRAHCAQRIEEMGGIKTFKVFVKEKRFKGKKISYQMTFHHLQHKSEGGKTTVENGANIEEIAHQYMHSLPREQEEIVNDMIREFKMGFGIMSGTGEILEAQVVDLDFNIGEDCVTIEAFDCTREEFEEMQRKSKNKREKIQKLKNPTRAMKKRELQELIDEEDWER